MALEPQAGMTSAEFQAAPAAAIAWAAPVTMVYAAAGTRRAAALAGIAPDSEAYASWSRRQMMAACRLIYAHGVKHLFTVLATPGQFQEVGRYRERLMEWIDWGAAGAEALDDYCELGWRVRLIGGHEIDRLAATAKRLRALPAPDGAPTLWLWVIPDEEALWRWQQQAMQAPVRTRSDAIDALYGEPVPPAGLFLGFGKPAVADYLLPPLLGGTVHCYWTQRPGYSLTQDELRKILFDYACVRPTWRRDKSGRGEAALADRDLWEREAILGLGRRAGPFWYPILPANSAAPGDGDGSL